MTHPLRIGTRGSRLALWQANHVAALLRPHPVELVQIETEGDQVLDVPLSQMGGLGVFTKEIQRALLDGRVDVAVHSLKDLPTIPVPNLVLGAVPERGPTGDAFVSGKYAHFDHLPLGATVATGSLRRQAQLLHRRPDLTLVPIRGNVETRLRKLTEENLDALVLAEAGLVRLELHDAITHVLDPEWMLPAVGQGALGLECRADDAVTLALLAALDHLPTRQAVTAERSLLAALGGGCLVPIGTATTNVENVLTLRAAVVSTDGQRRVAGERSGPATDAAMLGCQLAEHLLADGAGDLLRR